MTMTTLKAPFFLGLRAVHFRLFHSSIPTRYLFLSPITPAYQFVSGSKSPDCFWKHCKLDLKFGRAFHVSNLIAQEELTRRVENKAVDLCRRYLGQTESARQGENQGTNEGKSNEIMQEITPDVILENLHMGANRKWDCLDTVEFLLDVESLFDITIPDDVADNMKTLKDVTNYVVVQLKCRENDVF